MGLVALLPWLPSVAGADEGVDYDFDCSLGAPITVHGHVPATIEQGADLPLEDVFLEYTNPVGPVTYTGTSLSIPAPRGTAGPDHVIALPGEVALGEGQTYRSAPTSGAFRVTAEPGTVLELRPADLVVESASTVGGGRLACTFPGGQPAFARTTVVAPSGGASPGGLGAFPSAHAFVDQQHRDLLRRPPTATQLDRWVARLRDGMAPTRVVRKLMAAPRSAGVVAPIVRLYLVGFGLRPDYGALRTWTSRVRAGLPLSVVASAVTVSENPAAAGALSPEAFVDLVHRRAVGRRPDPAVRDDWAAGLRSGVLGRGQLLLALAESAEHRARSREVVDTVVAYAAMLRRVPLGREIDRGVGTSDRIGSILASAAYRGRIAARCDPGSLRYCARPARPGRATELSTVVPNPPLVLDTDPAGTVIDRAFSVAFPPDYKPWVATLYGEPGRVDPVAGRALVVGTAYEDSPTPYPGTVGFHPVPTDDGRTLGVGSDRAWTWAVWSGSSCECTAYVAGRQVSEAEVVTAARSVRGEPGQRRPTLGAEGTPPGLEPLVAGTVPPEVVSRGDRETLSFRTSTPWSTIDLAFTRADPRLHWLQRFWVEEGRGAVPVGTEAPVVGVRYADGLASAATAEAGLATPAELEALLAAARPARSGEWQRLQERARDEADLGQLCAGAGTPVAVLEGRVGSIRWGVGFDEDGGTCDMLLEPGREFDTLGASGGGDDGPGLSLFAGYFSGGAPNGVLLSGDAPPATARVRIEQPGRPTVRAQLAERGDRPGERWYAAFLADATVRPLTAVALDADGRELARRTSG